MRSLTKTDYYPPQKVPGPVPATEETLKAWLSEHRDDKDAFFALGCSYLRKGDHQQALQSFEESIALDPGAAEAHCNAALCCLLLDREDDAVSHLKQGVLIKPDLDLAYLHLARVQERRGELDTAIQSLERVLRHQPESFDALTLLGELWDKKGDEPQAERYFAQSFALRPKQPHVRNRLGWFSFRRGKLAFEEGRFLEAFACWGEGFRKYPRAFSADKEIARELYRLVKTFNEERYYIRELERYRGVLKQHQEVSDGDRYRVLSWLLFSLGLFPELYTPQDRIAVELAYWQSQATVEEEILPFPTFRVAILNAYQGTFTKALEELRICQDFLPKSKQQALHLKEMISAIGDISGVRITAEGKIRESTAGQDEWEVAGFRDPFQQQAWKRSGLSPEEAKVWKSEGFSAGQATIWAGQQFEAQFARGWLDAGFSEPKTARKWHKGDFSAAEAAVWALHFADSVEKAIQCRQAGFQDPETASRWLLVFMFPWEAIRWFELGFTTRDAAVYLAQGVKDPFQAKRQQEAEEALGQARQSAVTLDETD